MWQIVSPHKHTHNNYQINMGLINIKKLISGKIVISTNKLKIFPLIIVEDSINQEIELNKKLRKLENYEPQLENYGDLINDLNSLCADFPIDDDIPSIDTIEDLQKTMSLLVKEANNK